MTIYYYELETGYGEYPASSDEEALKKMPKNATILYKESDTPDGIPFITLFKRPK